MTRFRRIPPVVHWCEAGNEYLNLPADCDENGRRLGECPYCGQLIWEEESSEVGFKGGVVRRKGRSSADRDPTRDNPFLR